MAMSSKRYPHLIKQSGTFPDTNNVNTWETLSSFDYKAWTVDTTITVLVVPWDRDHRNTVLFDSEDARDAWCEKHALNENTVLDTPQNIQPNGSIRVPIPFDVMNRANYIHVRFPQQPIEYENPDSIRDYFFFINSVQQISPSTTECYITLDSWQTYAYRISVNYGMLERGHAPLAAAATVDEYLQSPLNHTDHLLTPDIDFGTGTAERYQMLKEFLLNEGDSYTVFASSGATGNDNWGELNNDNMDLPGVVAPSFGGFGGCDYLAINSEETGDFLDKIQTTRPWFYETIQAVFYISKKLVSINREITFCGHNCYWLDVPQKVTEFVDLRDKNKFGYRDEYKDLTKLYTNPYAKLLIVDDTGKENEIHIEDMASGKLDIATSVNLVAPFLGVDAYVMGLNTPERRNAIFKNTNQAGDLYFAYQGSSIQRIANWSIPQFAVFEAGWWHGQYSTHWSRRQAKRALDNAYDSAIASADTGYSNAKDSADTAQGNATRNASTTLDNTKASNKTSNDNVHSSVDNMKKNYTIAQDGVNQQQLVQARQAATDLDRRLVYEVYAQKLNIETTVQTETASHCSAAINNMASGAMTGAAAGPIGAASGAVTALAGSVVTGINDVVNTSILITKDNQLLDAKQSYDKGNTGQHFGRPDIGDQEFDAFKQEGLQYKLYQINRSAGQSQTDNNATNAISSADAIKETSDKNAGNSYDTAIGNTNRTHDTAITNAGRSQATSKANAGRSKNTSEYGIETSLRGAQFTPPTAHGNITAAATAETRPMGLFATIVTQSDQAIAAAGDYFLRYGYADDRAWNITDWTPMTHFTYWKFRDLWISRERDVPEDSLTEIESILLNGTTIWNKPEEIGTISIYKNKRKGR